MQTAASRAVLVERLDRESRESPGWYKFKLALLAGLGFAVLGGSATLALAASAGLVVVLFLVSPILLVKLLKIVWIPVAFGWLVLRALWIRFDPPDGHRLAPGEAPGLVAEVERLRRATRAPKLDAIIVNAELNAAAASVPRASGLFGHRHYLVLGLPLMQLLEREEMAAVIAHEFGHFGGGHNRFGGWIHQVRISWYRVLAALSQGGAWAAKPFMTFFDWYAPFFDAYSFSLARANEYQADAAAAAVVGPGPAGRALVRVHLGGERLERDFWPYVRRCNAQQPLPPSCLYRDMAQHLRSSGTDDAARLGEALTAAAGHHDTHPTLAQRLDALGVEVPRLDGAPHRSFADAWLGDLATVLEARFSDEWRQGVEAAWTGNHARHIEDSARLAELEQVVERSPEQAVQYALLVADLRPEVDALPLFQRAVEAAPDDALSRFRLGQLLLEREDAAGVEHVRTAMALDSNAIEPGAALLAQHFSAVADEAGQAEAEKALRRLYAQQDRTAANRGKVGRSDILLPHGLSVDALDGLRRQLDALGTVKKAWVVRKHVSDDPNELPHYVVLVSWRGLILSEDSNLQRVADALDLPGSFLVITAPNRRLVASRLKRTAGAPAYTR
ncbi:M48 family metalloprotease [Luteimonas sp. SJ-92]|uniref:M48 family metalloprotease n=1 Tax=Luteimonas salinisoli TaxID=2752307 RepID=A0A853JBG2_9GAMM|nr:M48 family metallopeptidase [Luteimonas salinisoli]NZA26573.1 M48 family metalloprotease [Luteimonas salinisoli]